LSREEARSRDDSGGRGSTIWARVLCCIPTRSGWKFHHPNGEHLKLQHDKHDQRNCKHYVAQRELHHPVDQLGLQDKLDNLSRRQRAHRL
jgi:hypothetical protein